VGTATRPDRLARTSILDVEQAIRDACRRWQVRAIVCDPFRWQRSMQVLLDDGLPVEEFAQTAQRMTPATTRCTRPWSTAPSPTAVIPG
jgi:hypothetical protein